MVGSGPFSIWRRFPAAVVFLAIAGCSTASSPLAANPDYQRDRRMFTATYEDIDELYIRKVDLEDLAIGGLAGLAAIDQRITAKQDGNQIDLLYQDKLDATFTTNDKFTPDDWAALMTNGVAAAKDASPVIAAADSEAIYKAVLNGMVARLHDPFSRYAGRDQAADNRASREGFGGIGVYISTDEGVVRITGVEHYLPAEKAGLQPGDVIAAVDGVPMKGLDQTRAVGMLRGPVDSRVLLTIQRKGMDHTLDVALTRALVVPETVTYHREGNIAYFRIYMFNEDTAQSLRREFDNARTEIGADRLRGVILDLRGDPGGVLDQAVAVADLFMNGGRIVSTHGRTPESQQYFDATSGDITNGLPIAVLINGNSASAAEIVAAALQDSGRAVIIGSNSYGKGTVQTVQELPNSGELALTWARYYAPSGYTLNHIGVLPQICTNAGDEDATDLLSELSGGKLKAVPVAARNSTSTDDIPALDKLRETCPAYKSERAVDLQVAIRLLTQPQLYAEAVSLAAVPAPTSATQSALTQSAVHP
jgi:carboxyl-terminal processing protease